MNKYFGFNIKVLAIIFAMLGTQIYSSACAATTSVTAEDITSVNTGSFNRFLNSNYCKENGCYPISYRKSYGLDYALIGIQGSTTLEIYSYRGKIIAAEYSVPFVDDWSYAYEDVANFIKSVFPKANISSKIVEKIYQKIYQNNNDKASDTSNQEIAWAKGNLGLYAFLEPIRYTAYAARVHFVAYDNERRLETFKD